MLAPSFAVQMEGPIQSDTSSGRFQGQWSFINPSTHPVHGHSRSLPPSSSYLRSERSSTLPQVDISPFSHPNSSGTSLSRIHANSVGSNSYSTATAPSQPVLSRIHSNVASHYLNPTPRTPRRRTIMNKDRELPPLSAYSFEGILSAIQEDIEEDLNGIAELLGRSRLVLADQHDSHLPPTGEIRAEPLQPVAEASSSNERLATDDVLILHEDASLAEGSQNGSHAYGLLERLQAIPRTTRMHSELMLSPPRPEMPPAESRNSSPAVLTTLDVSPDIEHLCTPPAPSLRASLGLLQNRTAPREPGPRNSAVVSEVWLSAGADGKVMSDPPVVSEAGKNYPLYSFDEAQTFGSDHVPPQDALPTLRQRIRRLLLLQDLQQAVLSRPSGSVRPGVHRTASAEHRLREILGRHAASASSSAAAAEPVATVERHPGEP